MGLSTDDQKSVERFQKSVVGPSQTKLVIVDFWAEWCGPCKALAPTLEKVATKYADKGVMLVKLDVDEEKFIASQFQVRSIPAVYAVYQGQPIADLTPARTESQLCEAIDKLLEQVKLDPNASGTAGVGPDGEPEPDLKELVPIAEDVLASGDVERAVGMFGQLAQYAPEDLDVQSGLTRALIAAGRHDDARAVVDAMQPEHRADPKVAQSILTLDLAANSVEDDELSGLRTAATSNPADMDAGLAFAEAAFASGARDEATDTLLTMIGADPAWNDGAAKAKLLQIFESVGLEDEWVSAQRRRLSILLFG